MLTFLVLFKVLVALSPVLIFLAVFTLLDAFKLMSRAELVFLLAAGGLIAALSYAANASVLDTLPIGRSNYSRYIAPWIEEGLKAAFVLVLFARNRVGFTIDAAIVGFAVGAGFSVVENGVYLWYFPGANLGVWLVRGFGTALMHGGTTAIFAALSQALLMRKLRGQAAEFRMYPFPFIPGYLLAALLHSGFNHLSNAPLIAMAAALLIVPLTLFAIFARSEAASQRWLVEDAASHAALLADIRSGAFAQAQRLAERFPADVLPRVLEYIELHADLVVRAEGALITHRNGDEPVIGAPVRDELARFHALEKDLGRSVLMALRPLLPFSRNDLWELKELEEDAQAEKK